MTQEQVKIFESPQFGQIRTSGTSDNPMFCLADICKVLDLNPSRVKDRLNQEGVTSSKVGVQTGVKADGTPAIQFVDMNFVNEQNLYKVIMRSDKPQAEAFQDWVCGEVLPSIRKSGGYIATTEQDDDKTILAKALNIMQYTLAEREKRLQLANETIDTQAKVIEEQQPLVTFANSILGSKDSCLVRDLAKLFTQNGIKIGQKTMFYVLKRDGYICRGEHSDNMPTQKAVEMGVMEYKETTIFDKEGKSHIKRTPKITQKGCQFFFDKYSKIYNERNQVKQ